jgi:hypothetical protein
MKVLTPGHKYELNNFEGKGDGATQIIQFIEKHPVKGSLVELVTVNDGTTNEEVLSMLINRLAFQGDLVPCRENALAKTRCEEALMWLIKRTADRIQRGVEGTRKV